MKTIIIPALILAGGQSAVGAITVQSYSYSGSPSASYPDAGGQELTDGVAIVPTWGGGNTITASQIGPFVGWLNRDATINFTFDTIYTIGQVTVWASDSDNAAGVELPTTITLTDPNSSFTQTYNVVNPTGNGYILPITISGLNVTTDQMQVSFTRRRQWTMFTEVSFESIPEPSVSALALLTTLFVLQRKKR